MLQSLYRFRTKGKKYYVKIISYISNSINRALPFKSCFPVLQKCFSFLLRTTCENITMVSILNITLKDFKNTTVF